MNSRAAVYLLLILALAGMGAALVWVIIRFATPSPEYVEIGRLTDFPPSTEPYFLNEPLTMFVVNYNDTLLALDPLNRVPGGYQVRWYSEGQAYIDPSRGTWFDRFGNPIRNPHNADYPVEKQGLFRYPVSIRGDRIIVEVSRLAPSIP